MAHITPVALLLIIGLVAPVLFSIFHSSYKKTPFIRRIPGIDAIEDAIGRTVELGRPISFTSGISGISPLFYASLGVLRYIAKKAAIFGEKLFVPSYDPEAMVLSSATVQSAYREENKFSKYDPSSIRYLSSDQFAFASGYMGLIHRENVGAAFLFGSFAAESLILSEAGEQVGAIQVAATPSYEQIPFFITSCDYTLIGEELYAAGAYLSKDPIQTGSLRGQDFSKLLILLVIIAGILIATYSENTESKDLIKYIKDSFSLGWKDFFNKIKL